MIKRLWNGTIEPAQTVGNGDCEIQRLERLILRNSDALESVLSADARAVFEAYQDCVNEHETLMAEQAFGDGFCLGVRLVAEGLLGAERVVSRE